MAEDKRSKNIKALSTYDLIQGKTETTIEEAITAALTSEDARPPMQITRDANNNQFQLELQRNVRFSTGGTYLNMTLAAIEIIIQKHFASKQELFKNWLESDGDAPFGL